MSTIRLSGLLSNGYQGEVGFTGSQGDTGFVGSRGEWVVLEGNVLTSDWVGSEPSVATIGINGILSTDTPIVDLELSTVTFSSIAGIQQNWELVYRVEASADNELKFYATGTPTVNFPIIITVAR